MPRQSLSGRAVLEVNGEDAEDFLQNLITTDLDALGQGDLKPGALLNPQGKILFEFLVSRTEGALRLDTLLTSADDLSKRLTLYKLRARVQIAVHLEPVVQVLWESESDVSETDSTLRDRRFPDVVGVKRQYGGPDVDQDEAAWTALRIKYGVAEAPLDYSLGDAFPHDVNLDQTGGVSFRKGCFVGQEVVSRMHHRGTARRRILVATGKSGLPEPGTAITANEREIGRLGGVAGSSALALARIDRVKDAMDNGVPILAGDIPIHLAIPPEHRFTFPEATQEA
ncbi:YgfZ/GcvT domain-containing protein [Phyllobacterium endophyticum]|uniref:CAF17-like 4Fe-4S cluster assembly/insertion protein YgfZ n=1 Tax=Phyllobacterium endophyticum TaxID=1149773 RepID=UPI0011CA3610|nr:folate-binding protein YgfZ [Phyllobacterium endophyticum]TXR46711.1 folate-binding protein YgfZ [Phyllobacterium endophyticum]